MPWPALYTKIAVDLYPKRWCFFGTFIFGVLLAFSLLISWANEWEWLTGAAFVALTMLTFLIWTWSFGFLLIVYWFEPGLVSRRRARTERIPIVGKVISHVEPLNQWVAALFLTILFLLVPAAAVLVALS
jgi:hypothetical protein